MTLQEYYQLLDEQKQILNNIDEKIDETGASKITQKEFRDKEIKLNDIAYKKTELGKIISEELTPDEMKEIFDGLKADENNNSVVNEIIMKKIGWEIRDELREYFLEKGEDNEERKIKNDESFESYYDRVKDLLPENLKIKYEEQIANAYKIVMPSMFKSRLSKMINVLDKYIPQEKVDKIIEKVDKLPSLMDKELKKVYDKEVVKALENAQNDKEKEILSQINEDILFEWTQDSNREISRICEYEGKFQELNQTKALMEFSKNNPVLKDKIYIRDGSFTTHNFESTTIKELYDVVNTPKFKIREKTKENIMNILKFFEETTDIDGNKLFEKKELEADQKEKVYSFKPYMTNREKTSALIKKLNTENLSPEERSKVMQDLNRCIEYKKDLDVKFQEIFSYIKSLGIEKFPANVTASRNEKCPEFGIKNFDTESLLNSFFYTFGMLSKYKMTAEEMLSDMDKTFTKLGEENKDFRVITDVINERCMFDDLDYLTYTVDYDKVNAIYLGKSLDTRGLTPILIFENDPELEKENTTKCELYTRILPEEMRLVQSYVQKTIGENAKNKDFQSEVMKNLICAKKDSSVSSLSLIPGITGLCCPFSGDIIQYFNRDEYLNKENIDADRIIQNIFDTKAEADKIINTKTIKTINTNQREVKATKSDLLKVDKMIKAAGDIAKELAVKNLVNQESFIKLYDENLCSAKDYIEGKKGTSKFEEYARDQFNNQIGDKLDENNIENSMIMVKAMSEKVRGMGFFKRHFTTNGRANKAIYNNMKNKIVEVGLTKKNLTDYLDGKINFATCANSIKADNVEIKNDNIEIKNDNVERKSIIVGEAKIENKMEKTSEIVSNEPNLDKTKTEISSNK